MKAEKRNYSIKQLEIEMLKLDELIEKQKERVTLITKNWDGIETEPITREFDYLSLLTYTNKLNEKELNRLKRKEGLK